MTIQAAQEQLLTMWAQTQLDMAVAPVHLANAIVALAQPSALIPPHQHPVTM